MDVTDKATIDKLRERIEQDGFAFVRDCLSADLVGQLRELCSTPPENASVARRGDSVYGIRSLLTHVPRLREILSAPPFAPLVTAIAGPLAKPVMGVYFDKPPGANWPVPWHQDVTFRVRQWREVPGFEPRPVRDGMAHVLPPVDLSERMLSIRIHLDDASSSHGALRVIPGSHRSGRLNDEQLQQAATSSAVTCEARTGDIMMMRPLIIHASSPCEKPEHRRVIQIEFATFELPGGLEWQG